MLVCVQGKAAQPHVPAPYVYARGPCGAGAADVTSVDAPQSSFLPSFPATHLPGSNSAQVRVLSLGPDDGLRGLALQVGAEGGVVRA
jgi:hypothetical protein